MTTTSETTSETGDGERLVYGIAVLALVPFRLWTFGFVTSKLYGWFVKPLSTALPEIRVAHWIGIATFLGMWTMSYITPTSKTTKVRFIEALMLTAAYWLSLLIGWVVS